MAGRIDLEYYASARRASAVRCPVEISGCVHYDTSARAGPIGSAHEAIQHGLATARIDLVDDTHAGHAAVGSSPIEIAGRVHSHRCRRVSSVSSRKAVQHRLVIARIHFEHHPFRIISSPS